MRELNDEEINALPHDCEDCHGHDEHLVAKAQYQRDLKDFIKILDCGEIDLKVYESGEPAVTVFYRVTRETYESLKQLVEE